MKYVYRNGELVPKDAAAYTGVTRGPYVIRDEMPPTEQVDGVYYTSKAKFRAKGRELGLTEVGTEKFKPRQSYRPPGLKEQIARAIEKVSSGWRPYPGEDRSRRMTRWR